MRRILTCAAVVAFGVVAFTSAGEAPSAEQKVRGAIERALPFVEKDGVAWIKRRDCMSCHVVTFMLWAHNEAKAHGIRVDETKVAQWTEFSRNKSLAARVFFKLEDRAAQKLPASVQP